MISDANLSGVSSTTTTIRPSSEWACTSTPSSATIVAIADDASSGVVWTRQPQMFIASFRLQIVSVLWHQQDRRQHKRRNRYMIGCERRSRQPAVPAHQSAKHLRRKHRYNFDTKPRSSAGRLRSELRKDSRGLVLCREKPAARKPRRRIRKTYMRLH